MTINELREKRNQAWNAAKAFVETKRDKDGLLSEEQENSFDAQVSYYTQKIQANPEWVFVEVYSDEGIYRETVLRHLR